jgi:ribosomal protein L30/L7E
MIASRANSNANVSRHVQKVLRGLKLNKNNIRLVVTTLQEYKKQFQHRMVSSKVKKPYAFIHTPRNEVFYINLAKGTLPERLVGPRKVFNQKNIPLFSSNTNNNNNNNQQNNLRNLRNVSEGSLNNTLARYALKRNTLKRQISKKVFRTLPNTGRRDVYVYFSSAQKPGKIWNIRSSIQAYPVSLKNVSLKNVRAKDVSNAFGIPITKAGRLEKHYVKFNSKGTYRKTILNRSELE